MTKLQDCRLTAVCQTSHPNRSPFSEHRLVEPRRCAKPEELRCLQHDVMVNIYCRDCQSLGCLLCADQQSTHAGHDVLTLTQAADYFKVVLFRITTAYRLSLNTYKQKQRKYASLGACCGVPVILIRDTIRLSYLLTYYTAIGLLLPLYYQRY